jgi:hypothetical protein
VYEAIAARFTAGSPALLSARGLDLAAGVIPCVHFGSFAPDCADIRRFDSILLIGDLWEKVAWCFLAAARNTLSFGTTCLSWPCRFFRKRCVLAKAEKACKRLDPQNADIWSAMGAVCRHGPGGEGRAFWRSVPTRTCCFSRRRTEVRIAGRVRDAGLHRLARACARDPRSPTCTTSRSTPARRPRPAFARCAASCGHPS